MSISRAKFGQMIRSRRRQANMTQEQVARQVGASTPYVGHLESGKRHPSDEIVTRLADALGFDRRELFFVANPRAKELLNPREQQHDHSAWDEFRRAAGLIRSHGITDKEMHMLSQVALLGQVRSSRDFIYILNTVRQALLS
ncbi:MAG: helix-turn-helix transcriptional regulator [Candidatus Binatus sp.]|uniref:helix-turn-helix domain-containing protein n=1 Tax=Candidatus Binatus sp. TaxID=2811406 RepID=UPI0027163ED9|nr:helix-turn-helix transcriptional regulator [Candidatus Binatus sp.]MDO8433013.1 helix-turn-helix transcriptional regulator [Candidatus Binatus sp.]